ncbi:Uncharacterized protein FWK35_00023095 [Aphis craccivora]|uniref:Uncharacterized protein n=1 Tax=Aphis craccivora TaxID=307492 RepID=A0A6G0YDF9_APHCR|nr:Uncharacterized protein FWK35_00023095 [Aphis craccivora]
MNVLILTSRVVFDGQVSIFGALYEVKNKHFLILTVFKKIEKNKNKVTEKREFLRKTAVFAQINFLYGCNTKNNHCKT